VLKKEKQRYRPQKFLKNIYQDAVDHPLVPLEILLPVVGLAAKVAPVIRARVILESGLWSIYTIRQIVSYRINSIFVIQHFQMEYNTVFTNTCQIV
jgi:hypothetical protein